MARVRESTLAKAPANESTRVQLDSCKLSDVSHKLNTGESKDSCKLHPGESKWTLVVLYEILPLGSGYFESQNIALFSFSFIGGDGSGDTFEQRFSY